jgi:hypothetical protein
MSSGLVRALKVVTQSESRDLNDLVSLARNSVAGSGCVITYTSAAPVSGSLVTEVWATRGLQERLAALQIEHSSRGGASQSAGSAAFDRLSANPEVSDRHRERRSSPPGAPF